MRTAGRVLLTLTGLAGVAYGLTLIYVPAAFVAGGAYLVYIAARTGD